MEDAQASELGALLAAAHSARGRQISLRGRLSSWRHQGRINRGFNRWSNARQVSAAHHTAQGGAGGAGGQVISRSMRVSVQVRGPAQAEVSSGEIQVAGRWPDRWRLEGGWFQGGPTLTVIDADSWMTWSQETGALSNFGAANHRHGNPAAEMLDPTPLLRSDIEGLRTAELVGRPTWHLSAIPRDREFHHGTRWAWEHCIDDYELDVDQETGLVVHLVGRVDGEDAVCYLFEEIQFDVDLAEDLFALVPPDGSEPKDARRQHEPPQRMPLHQAAREAGFTVFVPTRLPSNVSIQGMPFLWHGTLWIHFGSPTAPQVLTVWQRPPRERAAEESSLWERRTLDGNELEVHEDAENPGAGRLRMVRDGTEIEIAGRLPITELIEVLVSVQPADLDVPRL